MITDKIAKIVNLETYLVDVPVMTKENDPEHGTFPFKVSYGTINGLKRVFLKAEAVNKSGEKVIGWGEASPLYPYSNEDALSVYVLLKNYWIPALNGVNIDYSSSEKAKQTIDGILDAVAPFCCKERLNFTQTAIDFALHDLAGRLTGTPVYQLLNSSIDPDVPETLVGQPCWSISCSSEGYNDQNDRNISDAKQYAKKGYALKLKLGADLQSNIALTVALIQRYPTNQYAGIKIRVDANAAMSPPEFEGYASAICGYFPKKNLQEINFYVEEPINTKKYGLAALAQIVRNAHFGIMADESLYTVEDAQNLLRLTDGDTGNLLFNIKIQKVGGLKNAMEVAKIAQEKDVAIMIGGMFPSSLAKTVNCHYALAIRKFLESDGLHPSLDYIPEKKSVVKNVRELEVMKDGRRILLVFQGKPGFGTIVDEEIITQNQIEIPLTRYYPDFDNFKIESLEEFKR